MPTGSGKGECDIGPHERQSRRQHSNMERQRTGQGSHQERQSDRQRSAHEPSHKGRGSVHELKHRRQQRPTSGGAQGNAIAKRDSARSRGAAEKGIPICSIALASNRTKGGGAPTNPSKSGSGAPRAVA